MGKIIKFPGVSENSLKDDIVVDLTDDHPEETSDLLEMEDHSVLSMTDYSPDHYKPENVQIIKEVITRSPETEATLESFLVGGLTFTLGMGLLAATDKVPMWTVAPKFFTSVVLSYANAKTNMEHTMSPEELTKYNLKKVGMFYVQNAPFVVLKHMKRDGRRVTTRILIVTGWGKGSNTDKILWYLKRLIPKIGVAILPFTAGQVVVPPIRPWNDRDDIVEVLNCTPVADSKTMAKVKALIKQKDMEPGIIRIPKDIEIYEIEDMFGRDWKKYFLGIFGILALMLFPIGRN